MDCYMKRSPPSLSMLAIRALQRRSPKSPPQAKLLTTPRQPNPFISWSTSPCETTWPLKRALPQEVSPMTSYTHSHFLQHQISPVTAAFGAHFQPQFNPYATPPTYESFGYSGRTLMTSSPLPFNAASSTYHQTAEVSPPSAKRIKIDNSGSDITSSCSPASSQSVTSSRSSDASPPPEGAYRCPVCARAFTRPRYLLDHLSVHDATPRYPCRAGCERSFRDRSTRTKHERIHTGARPYVCPECGVGFSQSQNLKRHRVRIHKVVAANGAKNASL